MKTTLTRMGTLALASVLAASASGCGSTKSLSHAELVAKAEPICSRANNALDSSKIDPGNLASVAPGVGVAFAQAADELGKLRPPSSMVADWKVIVDGFRRAGASLQKIGRAAKDKQHGLLLEAEKEFGKGQNDRSTTATRNGFNDCAKF